MDCSNINRWPTSRFTRYSKVKNFVKKNEFVFPDFIILSVGKCVINMYVCNKYWLFVIVCVSVICRFQFYDRFLAKIMWQSHYQYPVDEVEDYNKKWHHLQIDIIFICQDRHLWEDQSVNLDFQVVSIIFTVEKKNVCNIFLWMRGLPPLCLVMLTNVVYIIFKISRLCMIIDYK